MSKFDCNGKIMVHDGERDNLVVLLLLVAAARRCKMTLDCELYIVNVSPTEPDTIWGGEAWSSREAHEASRQGRCCSLSSEVCR